MRVIYSIFFAEFLQTVQQQFAKRFAERCCVELHEPLVKRRVSQSIGGKNTLFENIFLLAAICVFLFDFVNQKVACNFFLREFVAWGEMAKLGCASGSVVVVGLGGNREVTVRHWKASETSKFCQTVGGGPAVCAG